MFVLANFNLVRAIDESRPWRKNDLQRSLAILYRVDWG